MPKPPRRLHARHEETESLRNKQVIRLPVVVPSAIACVVGVGELVLVAHDDPPRLGWNGIGEAFKPEQRIIELGSRLFAPYSAGRDEDVPIIVAAPARCDDVVVVGHTGLREFLSLPQNASGNVERRRRRRGPYADLSGRSRAHHLLLAGLALPAQNADATVALAADKGVHVAQHNAQLEIAHQREIGAFAVRALRLLVDCERTLGGAGASEGESGRDLADLEPRLLVTGQREQLRRRLGADADVAAVAHDQLLVHVAERARLCVELHRTDGERMLARRRAVAADHRLQVRAALLVRLDAPPRERWLSVAAGLVAKVEAAAGNAGVAQHPQL